MGRVLLLLKHKRTVRVLKDWLSELTEVEYICTAPESIAIGSFDLCICDSLHLRQMRATIKRPPQDPMVDDSTPARQVFLCVCSQHEDPTSLADYLSASDDILIRPLKKFGVQTRVTHFMHEQQLSQKLQDIVEEHAQTVEALGERERHYRNLFENASDGIAIFDLDGTVTSVNSELAAMLARPRATLVGKHYRTFTTPLSCSLAKDRADRALAGRSVPAIFELEFVRSDGQIRIVEVRDRFVRDKVGRAVGFQGIYRDITQRRHIEMALRQSEERFRSLSASSPIGIFQNDAQGACLYTNPRWQEIAGLSFEETLDTGWERAIVEADREAVLNEWHTCIAEEREFSREFRIKRSDGEIRWVHSRAAALHTDSGGLLGYVGTTEDITDRKRTAEALQKSHAELEQRVAERTAELAQTNTRLRQEITERKRLQEQLVERERLAALGRVTGAIAHELGTPLNSVLGYAQLLEQSDLPESAKRRLKIIESQAQRMAEIIQHYLSRTRDVRPSRQKVHPNELVHDTLMQLELRFEQVHIHVHTLLADALPPLTADATSLQRLLMNVLNNAIDAQPKGGSINLTTRLAPASKKISPCIVFEIADSGPGIPTEVLPHVFDLFFTTKTTDKGNGLGLAICQEIVKAHGGTIHVANNTGEGTIVTITLPVAQTLGETTGGSGADRVETYEGAIKA